MLQAELFLIVTEMSLMEVPVLITALKELYLSRDAKAVPQTDFEGLDVCRPLESQCRLLHILAAESKDLSASIKNEVRHDAELSDANAAAAAAAEAR